MVKQRPIDTAHSEDTLMLEAARLSHNRGMEAMQAVYVQYDNNASALSGYGVSQQQASSQMAMLARAPSFEAMRNQGPSLEEFRAQKTRELHAMMNRRFPEPVAATPRVRVEVLRQEKRVRRWFVGLQVMGLVFAAWALERVRDLLFGEELVDAE